MYAQWNPVNTVTSGPKKLAVLTGWPYYQGRLKFHDLRVVMTNSIHQEYTIQIAFTVLFSLMNNWNLDVVYSN